MQVCDVGDQENVGVCFFYVDVLDLNFSFMKFFIKKYKVFYFKFFILWRKIEVLKNLVVEYLKIVFYFKYIRF